jgi:glycine hydroxymethyltransferase
MKEKEIEIIADFIKEALNNPGSEKVLSRIKDDVRGLCSQFPVYRHRLI